MPTWMGRPKARAHDRHHEGRGAMLKWRSPLIVFLITTPILVGAKQGNWGQLADEHIRFAKGLAMEQVRFGPGFYDTLIKGNIAACEPIERKLAGLSKSQVLQINLYCRYFCRPWADAWAEAVWPCERRRSPAWCDDEDLAAAHLKLDPFFASLTVEVRQAADPLVRYNIMAMIAVRLSAKVIVDHPLRLVDRWVAAAVSEYLRGAPAEDAIAIGRMLEASSVGLTPLTAAEFESYVHRTSTLTDEQRKSLLGIGRENR